MKINNIYIWLVLILFIAGFVFPPIAKPVRYVTKKIVYTPGKLVYTWLGDFGQLLSLVGSIGGIAHENNDLKARNLQLESDLARMNEISHENEVLRLALKFAETNRDKKLITSKVIAHSPVNSIKTLVISSGKNEGVEVGQTVVYNGYLVGRISEVSNNNATVFLITNANSLVPSLLQKSRAQGLLRGGISGLVVEKIPLDVDIAEDEEILTSELGNEFVGDIPIGKISKLISKESEIYKTVSVVSPVEFNKLEVVFVLQ